MQVHKTFRDFSNFLRLFNDVRVQELSPTEITRALKLSQSKVSRMLASLQSEGFLEKNPETGKYRLGVVLFELGILYAFHLPLRRIIRPHLEQMAKELNFTASWGILRGNKIIVVDRIQNLNIDLISTRIGLEIPVHTSSIGKVLLAFLDEEEQKKVLKSVDLVKYTESSITDAKLIKENLKLIREKGFATDRGETHESLNCIAAPIIDGDGKVLAAINLMDETTRTSPEKLFEFAESLKEKALFISRQLGFRNLLV